jgi:trk system potassium uptake protein TrkH
MGIKIFDYYFKRLSFFSAAQLTVVSFVIMSIIGGLLLWSTEHNRLVHAKIPVHKQVLVLEKNDQNGELVTSPQEQIHTFPTDTTYNGEEFIDTLFTSVSALCVTGLNATDFSSFTISGQIVTLILIQMGGLGIILFTSIFAMIIARGISEQVSFTKLLSGILDTHEDSVGNMIRYVITYTFLFEVIGTLIMGFYLQFSQAGNLLHGINPWWFALFHSVSAFNNAGFGLLNDNLLGFVTDPVINFTIALLIILGGLGYPVIIGIHIFLRGNLFHKKDTEQHHLLVNMRKVAASSVQIRVAIAGTIILLLAGTLIPLIDSSHQAMLAKYSFLQQLMIMFFQSTSTRTAGFNTIDIGSLGVATLFLYITLMYIGANPAGTAGGIKIPTVAVLYGYIKDWFMDPGLPVTLLGKSVSKFAVSHAIRLFFLSTCTIAGITFLICIIEGRWLITPDPVFSFLKILFEVVSAFGTVGLSMGFAGGVTSFSALLTPASKFLIILTMLIGRLGPLTLLAALPWKKEPSEDQLTADYPDAQRIQIG